NQVSVFTGSGTQLVGVQAGTLSFDARGALSASQTWSADPTKDGVGTITLTSPGGDTTDLIANKSIQSGQIAAYLQMRDQILPEAQSQLDAFASQMARALSNQTTDSTPVTAGLQSRVQGHLGNVLPRHSPQ